MSGDRPLVYVDLDRTIFQTAHTQWLWQALGELYPSIDAAAQFKRRADYFVQIDDMYYHDMTSQLHDLGIDPDTAYAQLHQALADGRFEFDGTTELISSLRTIADVKILTFGPDAYQRFKAALCPSLDGLPVITTLRPKSEFFDRDGRACWLIDDKPVGDEVPAFVRFIQVSLEGNPLPPEVKWPLFTNLIEVKEYLHANLH